ncbi:MAG: Y-family DNA polymerase [Bacteroidetes bacterium]|nr:Y-family DNA polymerase [Bacteroidota bacterium]
MPKTFALVDCNNFYASCERIFNPHLEGKPLVVLSNNDGCIIARSDEAKKLGVKMGVPAFEIKDVLEKNNIQVFSTNYALYGDISQRVMTILSQFSPAIEIYSIDEAFLDLTNMIGINLQEYGAKIARTVLQWIGIPVTIGIAPTKTLAKAANHLAKEHPNWNGLLDMTSVHDPDVLLQMIPVKDIWGVGPQYAEFLTHHHIITALDLKNSPEKWIRKYMGVVGERTVTELRGIPCFPVDNNPSGKKGICISRSFGKPTDDYDEIEQATSTFIVSAAVKLRKQKSLAQALTVFVMTNRFAKGPQYVNGMTVHLPIATNNTAELIHHTIRALRKIFRKGYQYKKSGVIVTDIIPEQTFQCSLWDDVDRLKQKKLTMIIDSINTSMGKGKVKYAVQGTQRLWKMRQERLSQGFTTNWEELLTIDLDKVE